MIFDISQKLLLLGDFVKSSNDLRDVVNSSQQSPFLSIYSELQPFLLTLLKEFIYQDDIVEYACRIVKYSQRTLGN